jgi:voltage-gated potassium channel
MKIKPEFDLIPEEGWRKKIYEIVYLSTQKPEKFLTLLIDLIVFSTVL